MCHECCAWKARIIKNLNLLYLTCFKHLWICFDCFNFKSLGVILLLFHSIKRNRKLQTWVLKMGNMGSAPCVQVADPEASLFLVTSEQVTWQRTWEHMPCIGHSWFSFSAWVFGLFFLSISGSCSIFYFSSYSQSYSNMTSDFWWQNMFNCLPNGHGWHTCF